MAALFDFAGGNFVKRVFYIIDVFAEAKYAGNQLAVFRNAEHYSQKEMQKIAREMNYSETTFIYNKRHKDGSFRVRIFTPVREVPFAGHPTIGTAFIIVKEILKSEAPQVNLRLKVGNIAVDVQHDKKGIGRLTMRQKQPQFGRIINAGEIARILNLAGKDINRRFPCVEVSTGLPSLIVPLNSLDALKRCRVNKDLYGRLITRIDARALFVFSTQTHKKGNDISARCFPIFYGIEEDPATGSAAGCLAAYLSKYEVLGSPEVSAKIEQGFEINRPSILYIKASLVRQGRIDIYVGGRSEMIAKGEFL